MSDKTKTASDKASYNITPLEPEILDENGQPIGFSAEERTEIAKIAQDIDITDPARVLAFGTSAQKRVSDFSQRALDGVRGRDLDTMGDDISKLVVTLKGFDAGEEGKGGLLGFFRKSRSKIESLKVRYAEVEKSVSDISEALDKHQRTLLKDISLLDQMYEENKKYFRELTRYAAAGEERLVQAREEELPALQTEAEESGLAEDAQAAHDFAQMIDRFEKRVHDLELTRAVALQTAPQIRLIQAADQVMAEKIQSTVANTIPLWKNQMVIALGVEHTAQAAKAQHEVTEMTNQLLRENAERLHAASVATAEEAERGVVDIETLQHTNEELIATLDDIAATQAEGREKRRAAESQLVQIEDELKQKMLEVAGK